MNATPINVDLKVSAEWPEIPTYFCRSCLTRNGRTQARHHPQTTHIWGCLHCGYTTAAVYHYFIKIEPTQDNQS